MLTTGWADWSAAAESALEALQARTESVVVAGLSMGGSLTCWLATRHPELAGIICVNPAVQVDPGMRGLVASMVDSGADRMDAIGNDVADPEVVELAYDQTPLPPLLTMFDAAQEVGQQLGAITCPLLLMTSPQDHVVPPADSDVLAAAVAGPVERISLDRSFHVATIDFDRDLIARSALDFVARVTG
jgi:carboxylesterase